MHGAFSPGFALHLPPRQRIQQLADSTHCTFTSLSLLQWCESFTMVLIRV